MPPEIFSPMRSAHTCCSTPTIPSTGGSGPPRPFAEAEALNRPVLLSIGYARMPLVPCDGARVLCQSRHRATDERPLRQHQSRPRGAARLGPAFINPRTTSSSADREGGRSQCFSLRMARRFLAEPIFRRGAGRPACPPFRKCCAASPAPGKPTPKTSPSKTAKFSASSPDSTSPRIPPTTPTSKFSPKPGEIPRSH